jgi:UDP-N-acetylmuramoyl-L-alanyl-D-glutamate--2,6-diaminopimelate ligase
MSDLANLIRGVHLLEIVGSLDTEVTEPNFDSRQVGPGGLFVAVRGTQVDGHRFIQGAVDRGASCIVCEQLPPQLSMDVTYLQVPSSSAALGSIASNYYGHPSQRLKLIGVTGTNGKTTIATLLYRLFTRLGHNVGLFSTVENRVADRLVPATHTTADALQINRVLAEMVQEGCSYCFMEVSSHAIDQNRISGLRYEGGIFTNLTHDHLDYHLNMEAYAIAKKCFFDSLGDRAFALTNLDDPFGMYMLQGTKARRFSYSIGTEADFRASVESFSFIGTDLTINGQHLRSKLIGAFNVYNMLAIYGGAVLLGKRPSELIPHIETLDPAEGRFQKIESPRGVLGVVDYAHSPDAIENVLRTLRGMAKLRAETRIITVVGCGGDRDKDKRPIMARVACDLSDLVILTSDNPRSEDPETIISEMYLGVPESSRAKVSQIVARNDGIEEAVRQSRTGDIILIAGKGHEHYQEIQGVRHPFDDRQVLRQMFRRLEESEGRRHGSQDIC